MRNLTIWVATLLCLWPIARAADTDKPVVYTLSGPSSQRDDIVEKQYRKSYTVVELDQNKHTYERPARFESFVPPGPVYVEGKCVSGQALIYLVITSEGMIVSPYILASDNPAFDAPTISSATAGHYQPARSDGTPIAVIIGLLVKFRCP
jgi:hypothetical protein